MLRPKWNDYFLSMAIVSSTRSHDVTKVGAVLVKDKTILTTGYNGYAPDLDDSVLPKHRGEPYPNKYTFMQHAEKNLLLNCAKQGKSTIGSIAYVYGCPCFPCFYDMYTAGIKKIVYTDNPFIKMKLLKESPEWLTYNSQFKGKITVSYLKLKNLEISSKIFETLYGEVYNSIAES